MSSCNMKTKAVMVVLVGLLAAVCWFWDISYRNTSYKRNGCTLLKGSLPPGRKEF